jgi:hypothetical protein
VEFPHLRELNHEMKEEDFVLVSVETTNRPELARAFLEQYGADWTVLIDAERQAGELYELKGVPTNFFIDRQGRIMFSTLGFREGDEAGMREMIHALLARQS